MLVYSWREGLLLPQPEGLHISHNPPSPRVFNQGPTSQSHKQTDLKKKKGKKEKKKRKKVHLNP